MKKYKIGWQSKSLWLGLSIPFFAFTFYSRNSLNDILILSGIGVLCILSVLLANKLFYVTLINQKLTKVSFMFFKAGVDVDKIKKLEMVWSFGYELRIRDDSEYQMLMITLSNYLYHSKTLTEIIRDLKTLKPSIELDKVCEKLQKTGKWELPKLYLWEYWN